MNYNHLKDILLIYSELGLDSFNQSISIPISVQSDIAPAKITPAKISASQDNLSGNNEQQMCDLTKVIGDAKVAKITRDTYQEKDTKTEVKRQKLDELLKEMNEFEGCDLKKIATNTVFSDGNINSEIMLIGEAPGEEEDIQGRPFVGKSGQLLDSAFANLGLSRDSNIYIINVLPWRPPNNRPPTNEEIEICLQFLNKHIEIIRPKVLLLLGATAAKALLKSKLGITKIRGNIHKYYIDKQLQDSISIIPTFHPAYLLRAPTNKKFFWNDITLAYTLLETN